MGSWEHNILSTNEDTAIQRVANGVAYIQQHKGATSKNELESCLTFIDYGKWSSQWRPFDLLILVNYQWIAGSSYPELKRLERNLSWQIY